MQNPTYTNQIKLIQTPGEVVLEFSSEYDQTKTNEPLSIAMSHSTYQSLKELINQKPKEKK